jgi:thioredoxin 1
MLAPILENLDNHYNGKIKVVKINVDVNPDLAIKYDVQSIPTVYIFNN